MASAYAQTSTEWPEYGNDAGAMRFSPLTQITVANAARLAPAWIFRTDQPGSEAIPIMVGGTLYLTAPDGVYAVKPETGERIWKYETTTAALRGLAYWPGSKTMRARVFAGNGPYLLALDAATGKPAPGFGNEGRVDLKAGVLDGLKDGRYSLQSPPSVFGDIVITGCSNGENWPSTGAYGDIRGWDAKTGKLLWTFHTVPRPGEPGSETWPKDGWKNRSGTNVWGFFTIDVKRGIVYAPLGAPTSDFYGGDRTGDNLYGNTLVALDARTGRKLWHRQVVHHDLWDWDIAAPPALFDARLKNGRVIPAVAEITKMGLLFVFDRVTGEPVYGMEERPVPQSTVPGEVTAKTQPFPLKPPPLSKIEFRIEDLYNRSPEHAKYCRELFESNKMRIGGVYEPLRVKEDVLVFPSTLGGGNWGGVSIDPKQNRLFVNVMHMGQWGHMEAKNGEYVRTSALGPYARFWNREARIPCQNPPFGEMIAVDLGTGDVAWRTPLGRIAALEAVGVKGTGSLNLGGSIATAGRLVFIAATNDSMFRAFDSKTGAVVWEAELEASGHTNPITYQGRDGRQYVVIMAAGGGGYLGGGSSNALTAFALPDGKARPVVVSGGGTSAASHGAVATTGLSPKALFERTCTGACHTAGEITAQRMNESSWKALVASMRARGAQATDAEAKAIIAYLSTTASK